MGHRRSRLRVATLQTKNVWVPVAISSTTLHSSQPSAPSSSGAPLLPSRVAIPCHIAIGGTPRAKCSASSC